MTEKIPFTDATRGMFVARRPLPATGYEWIDTVTVLGSDNSGPYERIGPWLIAVDRGMGEGRFELPLRDSNAHRRFARLRNKNDMLRFANRYGLLGAHQETVVLPTATQTGRTMDLTGAVAEPLSAWEHEIRSMAILIKLWDLVDLQRTNLLSRFVFWNRSPHLVRIAFAYTLEGPVEFSRLPSCEVRDGKVYDRRGRRVNWISYVLASEDMATRDILEQWRHGDVLGPMRYHVINAINTRLRGHVNPSILFSGRLYFQPDSLLTALYTLFALEVSGQDQPNVLCARPGCGRYFTPSRKGQKYCHETCRKLAAYHRKKE